MAHAFLWEYSYKGLELAQLLGRLGVFLTLVMSSPLKTPPPSSAAVLSDAAQDVAPRVDAVAEALRAEVAVEDHVVVRLHPGENDARLPLAHPLFHTKFG